MERRDFLKLTLGLLAAAGAVAGTAVASAEAATPQPPGAKGPSDTPEPDENAAQPERSKATQAEPDELGALDADDSEFSARRWWRGRRVWYRRHRRRWWRRRRRWYRRRVWYGRRRRWYRRRRRLYYY